MKRIFLALMLLVSAVPAFAQETRIAAVVNDDVISDGDLAARMRLIMASSNIEDTPQNRQRLTRQVLRILIDEKLEMQEAKRLSIKVTDKEIDDALGRIAAQNNVAKDGLDKFLSAHGLDRSALIDQLTPIIAWGKVVRQRLAQEASVSDEEIDAAMARVRDSENEARARVAEIFLAVDSPQQDDEVHHFADRLYDQLRGGANFAAVAQQFSQSASAAVGGDIGWVTASQLNSELGKAVQSLNSDQYSQPIRAAGGYYIVLVIQKAAPNSASAEDARVSLTQVMFPLPPNATDADRQRVTAQAESLTKDAKSCGELAQIGHAQAPQTSGDLGRVRVGDLPADLRPTVLALKVAEPSKPVPLRGGIGVLMVCEREASPSAMPTRDQVADQIAREHFETLARRYLRDLRRAAYVDQRV